MRWIILGFAIFVCTPLGKRIGEPRKGTSLQSQIARVLLALHGVRPNLHNLQRNRIRTQMHEDVPPISDSEMEMLRARISRIQKQGSSLLATPENYVALVSSGNPAERLVRFSEEQPEATTVMQDIIIDYLGCLPDGNSNFSTTVDNMAEILTGLLEAGYMFRNAEYLKSIRNLLSLQTASMLDLRQRFDEIDIDKSGYIEKEEIRTLLANVLEGAAGCTDNCIDTNADAFLHLVDTDRDGRVSWDEFLQAFGVLHPDYFVDEAPIMKAMPQPEISGIVTLDVGDEKVQVDAKVYLQQLQEKCDDLQKQLGDLQRQRELEQMAPAKNLKAYVSSLTDGKLKIISSHMSEEVRYAMKQLVDFMFRKPGGQFQPNSKTEYNYNQLRTIFLQFLVYGYQLREKEADELNKNPTA